MRWTVTVTRREGHDVTQEVQAFDSDLTAIAWVIELLDDYTTQEVIITSNVKEQGRH